MSPQSTDQSGIPDPARSYERAKPEHESGMGRLENDRPRRAKRPDRADHAVKNAHPPRQSDIDRPAAAPTDHSMSDEEPLGEDLMPTDIHDPEGKRHPRTEGKGGTPK